MSTLTFNINNESLDSIYEQIYNYIKNEIKSQNLLPGDKLPSSRSLARHLMVSRSTILMAYDQLLSEGYLISKPSKGYFVCELDGLYDINTTSNLPVIDEPLPADNYKYDFSPRGIALDAFPFNAYRKISKNVLTSDNAELFNNGLKEGELSLRNTIRDYLYQSRGVICDTSQIIIGAGNEYLLMLLNLLIDKNSVFAMENPTYMQAYNTLKKSGRNIIPIHMDSNGINIDSLKKSNADIAYVMPSHQFPTGILMPLKRRQELLKWANEKDSHYIIEDDYDSEFRYKGRPVPSLQGSAGQSEKVIYLGTFSKAIAPAIRMSYLVLPNRLLEIYHRDFSFLSNTVSRIDQNIVDEFIKNGYYERHLNKLRALYKSRHDIILNELKPFEKKFTISGEYSGIHILLTAQYDVTEEYLVKKAKEHSIKVYPLSNYMLIKDEYKKPTILIGYANISSKAIVEGINLLKKAWEI